MWSNDISILICRLVYYMVDLFQTNIDLIKGYTVFIFIYLFCHNDENRFRL